MRGIVQLHFRNDEMRLMGGVQVLCPLEFMHPRRPRRKPGTVCDLAMPGEGAALSL